MFEPWGNEELSMKDVIRIQIILVCHNMFLSNRTSQTRNNLNKFKYSNNIKDTIFITKKNRSIIRKATVEYKKRVTVFRYTLQNILWCKKKKLHIIICDRISKSILHIICLCLNTLPFFFYYTVNIILNWN